MKDSICIVRIRCNLVCWCRTGKRHNRYYLCHETISKSQGTYETESQSNRITQTDSSSITHIPVWPSTYDQIDSKSFRFLTINSNPPTASGPEFQFHVVRPRQTAICLTQTGSKVPDSRRWSHQGSRLTHEAFPSLLSFHPEPARRSSAFQQRPAHDCTSGRLLQQAAINLLLKTQQKSTTVLVSSDWSHFLL